LDLNEELAAKGRMMNKPTKRYVGPDRDDRANAAIEAGTHGRTNPLARDAHQEAGKENAA
jgi:hypothetical protein